MATSFLEILPDFTASAALDHLTITTTDDYENVTVFLGGVEIYYETLFAYGGKIVLHNLREMVESEMRQRGLAIAWLGVDAGTATIETKVVYCDRMLGNMEMEKFLEENFMTTLPFRRVAPSVPVILYMYDPEDEYDEVEILYRSASGVNGDDSWQFDQTAAGEGLKKIVIDYDFLCSMEGDEISVFTVRAGERSVTCYVDPEMESDRWFTFRNCFNVEEVLPLTGQSVKNLSVEKSEAVINGRRTYYDRKTTRSEQMKMLPLTYEEAVWMEQFLTSSDVKLSAMLKGKKEYRADANISDFKYEIADRSKNAHSVEFTFSLANGVQFFDASSKEYIFQDDFNLTFS